MAPPGPELLISTLLIISGDDSVQNIPPPQGDLLPVIKLPQITGDDW